MRALQSELDSIGLWKHPQKSISANYDKTQGRREVFSVITYFEKKTQQFRASSALQHAADEIRVF